MRRARDRHHGLAPWGRTTRSRAQYFTSAIWALRTRNFSALSAGARQWDAESQCVDFSDFFFFTSNYINYHFIKSRELKHWHKYAAVPQIISTVARMQMASTVTFPHHDFHHRYRFLHQSVSLQARGQAPFVVACAACRGVSLFNRSPAPVRVWMG